MALPTTGEITLYQVRTELGQSGQIGLTDSTVRNLAGIPSGQISLFDLRGQSAPDWTNVLVFGQTNSSTRLTTSITPSTVDGSSIPTIMTFSSEVNFLKIIIGGNRVGVWQINIEGLGAFNSSSSSFESKANLTSVNFPISGIYTWLGSRLGININVRITPP